MVLDFQKGLKNKGRKEGEKKEKKENGKKLRMVQKRKEKRQRKTLGHSNFLGKDTQAINDFVSSETSSP